MLDAPFTIPNPQQCKTCPWRKESSCKDIPNYDPIQHEMLRETLQAGIPSLLQKDHKIMSCHYSDDEHDLYCIGWLNNQLNNDNLRVRVMIAQCINRRDLELDGEQVETFDETFK